MKKLLGIVVLGLLLSGNVYAANTNLYLKCPETITKVRSNKGGEALIKEGKLLGTNYIKLKSKSIITIHYSYEITKDKPYLIVNKIKVKKNQIGFNLIKEYSEEGLSFLDSFKFIEVENGYEFTSERYSLDDKNKSNFDYDTFGKCENISKKEYKKLLKGKSKK